MVDLNEAAAAIRQHKGLGSEGRATERMSSFSALAEWRRRRQTLLGALLNPIATLLGLVAIAVILVISVRSDVFETGEAEVASLLLFLLLITRLLPIISMVNANYGTVKGVAPSVAKVNKIIDIDPSDLEDYDGQTPTPLISDRISFRDVTFAYEGKGPALRNVTFDIPAGSTVAVVGESGAGKSTVADLLPRFYETQSGSVQYDGADVKSIDLNHLRDRIGIVSQGLILFADTVEENIRAGKPDATGDQIVAAAKQASAHEFIEQLPSKYQTLLGERGVTLSEGQRQRIAIAQAFLKSPELLILDEATSALDSESEMRVQEAIEELSAGRTVLLVAHRLTTVKGADTVVVLKDGTIAEMGTIEELLSSRGEFWKMCERQGLSEDDMIAAS